MKVRSNGKHLWMRTITSTFGGQFVNTILFYVIALSGILPANILVTSIIFAWLLKVAIEVVLTPVTCWVINRVKKIEGEDHYDRDTDFNPLSVKL